MTNLLARPAENGPAIVWSGPSDADLVAVIDPAGEAVHGGLPATWRPLAEWLRVGWVRLPADGAGIAAVDAALAGAGRAHVVAAGVATEVAMWVAAAHTGDVSSFTAVDPLPCLGEDEGWWERSAQRGVLEREGILIREVRTACPPAPLGLPEVVIAVAEVVASFSPR